jgi:hypothetical protein
MTAISIAYAHHARSLAVLLIAALIVWAVVEVSAWVRSWLIGPPPVDVYGEVERGEVASVRRGMAGGGRRGR